MSASASTSISRQVKPPCFWSFARLSLTTSRGSDIENASLAAFGAYFQDTKSVESGHDEQSGCAFREDGSGYGCREKTGAGGCAGGRGERRGCCHYVSGIGGGGARGGRRVSAAWGGGAGGAVRCDGGDQCPGDGQGSGAGTGRDRCAGEQRRELR